MKLKKLEKILLILCIISVVASVGYYVKSGYRTYSISEEDNSGKPRINVKVTGEVKNPGTYRLDSDSRACDAIYAAGGITNNADIEKVTLDAILTNNMEVYVPEAMHLEYDGAPVVNINKADAEMLALVPGIGEELAERIIAYRTAYGPFSSVDEITYVKGIGDKNFEKIKDYIKTEE